MSCERCVVWEALKKRHSTSSHHAPHVTMLQMQTQLLGCSVNLLGSVKGCVCRHCEACVSNNVMEWAKGAAQGVPSLPSSLATFTHMHMLGRWTHTRIAITLNGLRIAFFLQHTPGNTLHYSASHVHTWRSTCRSVHWIAPHMTPLRVYMAWQECVNTPVLFLIASFPSSLFLSHIHSLTLPFLCSHSLSLTRLHAGPTG